MTEKDIFRLYRPIHGPDVWVPVYMSAVPAGFPSRDVIREEPSDDKLF